ncbi:MAG: ImmA/IrrE family metallo-endopeptidase [Thermoguttaceae bacterium]|jgi:hypothetical protein
MTLYVPAVAPMSRQKIEEEALAIISRYYPKLLRKPGPFPVLAFFDLIREEFGLDPGVEELSDGVEGMTFPNGCVLVCEETYRGASEEQGRPRFTIPHECYHGIKHKDQIRKALMDTGELVIYRRQLIKPFVDPEWQANAFAAAVLMPEPMVRMLAAKNEGMQLLDLMIKIFKVSPKAAEVRLEKLRI